MLIILKRNLALTLALLLALMLALPLAACNPFAVLDGVGEEVERFHTRLAANDIDAMWEGTHEQLQGVTSRGQFEATMRQQQQIMGAFESTEREGFNINTNNGVTSTTVTMQSEYANGSATEVFTFIQDGGDEEWLLTSYDITSEAYERANGQGANAGDPGAAEDDLDVQQGTAEGADDADQSERGDAEAAPKGGDNSAKPGGASGKPGQDDFEEGDGLTT